MGVVLAKNPAYFRSRRVSVVAFGINKKRGQLVHACWLLRKRTEVE